MLELNDDLIKACGHIAVVMGGCTEREISLMSGRAVFNALQEMGFHATAVEVEADLITPLQAKGFDRVFNLLHGGDGESGIFQSICQNLRLPHTDSSPLASALAMNKCQSKRIFLACDLPTADYLELNDETCADSIQKRLGLPFVVKPADSGSSCGVSIVKSLEQYTKAYQVASQYSSHIMAEQFIDGDEISVGILADEALPLVKIVPEPGHFYGYEDKYFSDNTQYLVAEDANCDGISEQAADLALKVYRLLGCENWGRVDFLLDKQDKLWILELNTVPGMTPHSLVPQMAKRIGIDFNSLVLKILTLTLGKTNESQTAN